MADSEASRDDKQLPASERRLRQAAEEGQVARSRDAAHVLVLGAGVSALAVGGVALRSDLVALIARTLTFDGTVRADFERLAAQLSERFAAPVLAAGQPVLAVLAVTVVGAIAAGVIPGGLHLAPKALAPNPSRLDPMAGFGRIASLRNLIEFGKLATLAIVLGAIGLWFCLASLPEFASLSLGSFEPAVGKATSLIQGGLGLLALLLVAIALFDVPFQWFRHRADLRMTREEARQEARESEGDPQMRGRIRSKQREVSRRKMLAAVPAADIVVVNPTHYAVALRYEEATMTAPRVVAKGVDLLAARIQAIAREAGVPVLQAPPLARALHAHVELDHEVPRALYAAIAQVLAYVYQLERWVPGRSAAPKAPIDIEVPAGMDPKADARDAGGAV